MKPHSVFVSHAHVDNELCDRFVAALKARGLDVWYDRTNLDGGRSLSDEIQAQLHARTALVIMLTPAAIDSYWVKLETDGYRDLAAHDPHRLMLPVRITPCEIPVLMRGLKWIDAARMPFDQAVDEIARSLGAPSAALAAAAEPHNPIVKWVPDEYTRPMVLPQPRGIAHRTFGGPPRRQSTVRLFDDEVVVAYIMRHWFILVRREILPALVTLAALVATLVRALYPQQPLWWLGLVGVAGGLMYGALVYLNYVDDVFVLTTNRIIDIDRFLIFFEGSKQAEYSKVQDVRVEVKSLIGRLLNYGHITAETAGRLPNIDMTGIPDPFAVQDMIFSRINAVKESAAAAAANRQQRENGRILAALMNEVLVEVPDVCRFSAVEAGQRLGIAGLRLVVDSERRMPGWLPGLVVDQMPRAATTTVRDSDVRVVLSGLGGTRGPRRGVWPLPRRRATL